jgi:hypothetical protein
MTSATSGKNFAIVENEKPKTINEALLNVCAGVSNVKRDTKGQVGNQVYHYATLESVLEVVNPLLSANGLALVQYVDDDTLRALLIHESGDKLPLGGYNLGGIGKHQERGSAITYGRRYQLCAIFGITQEDDDGAAASKGSNANKMTSGVSPQSEFGTAVEFKKYHNDTMGYIEGMINKEQSVVIRKRIARVAKVDDQYASILTDALESKLDGIAAHE